MSHGSERGLAARIEYNWYHSARGNLWLLPLWLLFVAVSGLRRLFYRLFPPSGQITPVLVVGNIAVGGTGKTPLIQYLVARSSALGLRPGIVSRGYGGKADSYPLKVSADTPVEESGDEPRLLFASGAPVVVDPVRSRAVAELEHEVDIIFSDDGLQHYAMARDAEIVVSDHTRGFGNGWQLPVGPLREPISRLKQADLHLVNGQDFTIVADSLVDIISGREESPDFLRGQTVHAVAGIGNPQRFYTTLREAGVQVIEHPFPDHHAFVADDLKFDDGLPVVMTEKDWVKCSGFALSGSWYLKISAVPGPKARTQIDNLLKTLGKRNHG